MPQFSYQYPNAASQAAFYESGNGICSLSLGALCFSHPMGKLMKCCTTYHHVTDVLEAAYVSFKGQIHGKRKKEVKAKKRSFEMIILSERCQM